MRERDFWPAYYAVRDRLSPVGRQQFDAAFESQRKNPVLAFGLNGYLGILGADRFYLGQWAKAFLKLITLGGLAVWILVDLFLIAGATRAYNLRLANRLVIRLEPGDL